MAEVFTLIDKAYITMASSRQPREIKTRLKRKKPTNRGTIGLASIIIGANITVEGTIMLKRPNLNLSLNFLFSKCKRITKEQLKKIISTIKATILTTITQLKSN